MRISDWSSDVCSSDLEDHGQRDLTVAEIVADALAHRFRVRDIVDRVVDELEGDAEVAAIGVERGFGRLIALGTDRGDLARRGETCGGIGVADRERLVLARLHPPLARKPAGEGKE